MTKKITIIHTTPATIVSIPKQINQIYKENFEIVNLMDDSLLNEIKEKGELTKSVMQRFMQYVLIAQNNQSDAILLACSSIGVCGNIARSFLSIPLFKIDEPMAEKAVDLGNKILVLGTVKSTMKPTVDLIQSKANSCQCIESIFIDGVFALHESDIDQHDQKIAEVVKAHKDEFDVFVLAQASMAGALRFLDNMDNVLTSLPLGLYQLKSVLKDEVK